MGKRRGKKTARTGKKTLWIKRIRSIRNELTALREKKKINRGQYAKLYKMAGSGIFKDKANLHLHVSKMKEAESVKNE